MANRRAHLTLVLLVFRRLGDLVSCISTPGAPCLSLTVHAPRARHGIDVCCRLERPRML